MYEKLQKNTAQYIVFPLVDADGDFVSGATITGVYNYWEKGSAPQASFIALTNAEAEIGATGVYYVQLTTGETNHGYVTVLFTSGTSKPQLLEFICIAGDPLDLSVHNAADIWTEGGRALTTPADYKATGFSVHSAADVWSVGTKEITGGVLTTPADYKATGFSTHSAADIWTAGSRALSTPNDYKAIGFSTHNAAAIWTAGSRELSTPANYMATGFSVPNEYDAVITALQTDLDNPTQYKATGFSTHNAGDIWTVGSRVITGGVLTTPNDYKATGFSTHVAADVWGVVTRALTDKSGFTISGTTQTFDALDTLLDSAHGAGSWLTGGGGSGIVIQVIPSIPKNIDLSDTKTVRIGLYVIDASDDLPTTGELTAGTIKIERSADGGTSWSTIRNDVACSKHAGAIYYDEVFSSGNGYASADMIKITFKSQKATISANDFEIADATDGVVFITRMDSGLSAGGGATPQEIWEYASGGGRELSTPANYKATGFSTHGEADVWTTGSRELSTPANYKATGFSVHSAADIWSVGSRIITGGVLTTPNDYKANVSGLSTHVPADIWTAGSRELSTPANYKATGFSTHSETDVWSVVSRVITGGVLTTPADYMANISALALEATVNALNNITAANVWAIGTKIITGGVLTTPANYMANVSGLAPANEYDAELTAIQSDLNDPAQYKADVSLLALETTVQAIKALTDNLPADTELELIKLKGVGGIWLVAEYHHDINNDNDYINFWQYGNQTDFDNETKANAVNKWRQDITYTANLPQKSKWDKVT